MLSDHEQRVLDELDRDLASSGPRRGRRRSGLPWPTVQVRRRLGLGLLVVLGSACTFLLFSGVGDAALALAVATALGWLFRSLCRRHRSGAPGSNIRTSRTGARFGTSVRTFLGWLTEVE